MKKINEIRIYQFQNDTSIKLIKNLYNTESYKKIFNSITDIIKKNSYNINLIIDNIINDINDDNSDKQKIDYIHSIYIFDEFGYILYKVTNKYNILIEHKKIILKKDNSGNCIDDFINRGILPNINSITNFCDAIKSRKSQRTNNNEYHQTSCYEYDFSQIVKIKEITEKILENCNRQLEAISEKYTKF